MPNKPRQHSGLNGNSMDGLDEGFGLFATSLPLNQHMISALPQLL